MIGVEFCQTKLISDGGMDNDEGEDGPDYIYFFFKQTGKWVIASIGVAFLQTAFGETITQFARNNLFISGFVVGLFTSIVVVGLVGIIISKITPIIQWRGLNEEDIEVLQRSLQSESWNTVNSLVYYVSYFAILFIISVLYTISIQYIQGIYIFFTILFVWITISIVWVGRGQFEVPISTQIDKFINRTGHLLNGILLGIGIGYIIHPSGDIETFWVIAEVSVPVLLGSLFPDLDAAFGKHRKTLHNIPILFVFIIFPIYTGNLQFVWIGVLTHYILDITGSIRGVSLFYPILHTEFGFPISISARSRYRHVLIISLTALELLSLAVIHLFVPQLQLF